VRPGDTAGGSITEERLAAVAGHRSALGNGTGGTTAHRNALGNGWSADRMVAPLKTRPKKVSVWEKKRPWDAVANDLPPALLSSAGDVLGR
jgi:hypothetical protein